jgi:hypothetical protein
MLVDTQDVFDFLRLEYSEFLWQLTHLERQSSRGQAESTSALTRPSVQIDRVWPEVNPGSDAQCGVIAVQFGVVPDISHR